MQKTKLDLQYDFKKLLASANTNQSEVAKMLGVTQGAVTQKISNFSWRYIDLVNLLDKLGYDVVWVKRDEQK